MTRKPNATISICLLNFLLVAKAFPGNDEAIVALWGSDTWNTQVCSSVSKPDCQIASTIDEAQAAIKRFGDSGTTASGKHLTTLRVLISPGVHRLTQPLRIENWGISAGAPSLVIQGAGRNQTVLVGSVSVPASEWLSVSGHSVISPAAASNLRVINYRKLVGRDASTLAYGELFGHDLQSLPLSLVYGGHPMTLARWPKVGYGIIKAVAQDNDQQTIIRFSSPEPYDIPEKGALISGYLAKDWGYERIPISRDGSDPKAAVAAKNATALGLKAGQRVILENSLAQLDSPNEWMFEGDSQDLYFWPPSGTGAGADSLELVIADGSFRIKNSRNVTVKGLALQNVLGDAVVVDGSSLIVFSDIDMRNIGNRAISIAGGEKVSVQNCLIEDTGAGGIYIYGGDRNSLRPGNHRVEGCEIRRFAQRIKTYQPAIRLEGVGNVAFSNFIHDAPHSGIIFNGNDQLVDANHLSDVVSESDDAGAIYTGRDWTARGSVVRNNFVKNIKGKDGAHQAVGLYLDDQASGVTAEDNIFCDVGVGVLVGGGRDNILRNNIFVNNRSSIAVDARGVTWQKSQTQDPNGTLLKALSRIPIGSAVFRQKYPHLADLRTDDLGVPKYDEFHWNLFVASGGIDARDAGYFSFNDSENVHVGMDVLKSSQIDALSSPQGYELNQTKLPASWRVVYPSRKTIPN